MPTYEYRCTECGNRIEVMQRMSDAPLTLCPACQKDGLTRVVSGGVGVLYKGEGWYVTDYSKKSSGGKDTPSTSSSSGTSTSSGSAPKKTSSGSGTSSTESPTPAGSSSSGSSTSSSSSSESSAPAPKTGT